ncbi:hypothetical protein [Vibrio metschnikovii]|nr:hypothetical protein [Vibrio metschnikovii]
MTKIILQMCRTYYAPYCFIATFRLAVDLAYSDVDINGMISTFT